MQIYNVSNSLPEANKQHFQGAKFFRVPDELKQVILKNDNFDYLAKRYNVDVTATPRATWKDPLRLRKPKADEKSYLTCEIKKQDEVYGYRILNVTSEKKLLAPLQEHVQSFLKMIEEISMKERLENLIPRKR